MTTHVLASRHGLRLFIAHLIINGEWCTDCGFGTAAATRSHRRCKKCGQLVPILTSLTPPEQELYIALQREAEGAA